MEPLASKAAISKHKSFPKNCNIIQDEKALEISHTYN